MKQLSLTQEYLLCVLNKNGKLSAFDLQKILCLSAAGVLELLLDDVFVLDGKKLKVRWMQLCRASALNCWKTELCQRM